MLYDLSKNNPYDRDKFIAKVQEFLEKGCVVKMGRKAPTRTNQQNKYLHVILAFFGCETGLSKEDVKSDVFKRLVNPDIFLRVITTKQGFQTQHLRSSAELTTAELTTCIERFRNFASSQLGIYLPAPNEEQFLTHCEKVIEQNKEFITQYSDD